MYRGGEYCEHFTTSSVLEKPRCELGLCCCRPGLDACDHGHVPGAAARAGAHACLGFYLEHLLDRCINNSCRFGLCHGHDRCWLRLASAGHRRRRRRRRKGPSRVVRRWDPACGVVALPTPGDALFAQGQIAESVERLTEGLVVSGWPSGQCLSYTHSDRGRADRTYTNVPARCAATLD